MIPPPSWRWVRVLGLVSCAVVIATGMSVSANGFGPTEEQYTAIQAAFLREDFEKVVQLVQPLIVQTANEPTALLRGSAGVSKGARVWLWYVLSLERLQRLPESLRELDHLKTALSGLPSQVARQADVAALWPEVCFWDGEISRKALKMVRARLAYNRLLTEFPQSSWKSQALLGLGLVLFHQQEYDAAGLQFHEMAAHSPSPSIVHEALLLEGLSHLQRRQLEDAITCFQHLIDQAGEQRSLRAQASFYLGEAMTELRRFEEAELVYRQAIEADPESKWARLAYFGLGWSEFQQHRCRESLESFDRYLAAGSDAAPKPTAPAESAEEVEKSPVEMLLAQGRCLIELGREREALERFDQLRTQYPDHPLVMDAMVSVAEVLQRQQRVEEARSLLEMLVRHTHDPAQRAQAHLQLGSLELAHGDATKAAGQFQLAKDAQDPALRQAALNGLADAQLSIGNAEEAMRWYEEALKASRNSPAGLYAAYQVGRLKLQAGQVDDAIERFQWLVSRAEGTASPTSAPASRSLEADARLALVFAYLTKGQPDDARRELELVRAQDPDSPQTARAGYYLALLALHDGHFADAKQWCEDVIQRAPQSDEALEARLLLVGLVSAQTSPAEALSILGKTIDAQGIPPRHRGRLAKKLADLARQAGVYAQAIHWYEVAWEDVPSQRGELDYRMASCYEEAGDLAVAANRYRAISQAPWQIRGQLAAAKLMEREEQWQEAMKIYEFITRQPVPEAKTAQERLMSLNKARP